MNDIKDLELQYKLRENWLDIQGSIDKPFTSDLSVVLPPTANKNRIKHNVANDTHDGSSSRPS